MPAGSSLQQGERAGPAPLLRVAALPSCVAALAEPWDAPGGRFFAGYRARGAYRWFLGQGVIDEFATLSSPVFVAPASLLGRVYDAGLTLAFDRHPELPLDRGWPPVCLGVEAAAPPLPEGWEEELLAAVKVAGGPAPGSSAAPVSAPGSTASAPGSTVSTPGSRAAAAFAHRLESRTAGPHRLELLAVGGIAGVAGASEAGEARAATASRGAREVVILATDAPLLPAQLGRLAEAADAAFALALSTGNRLAREERGRPQGVSVLSENALVALIEAAGASA